MKTKYNKKTDNFLIKKHEKIISILTAGKGTTIDKLISDLLELERELTLRETY